MSPFLAAMVVCILVTGCFHSDNSAARIHWWAGHLLVVAVWLFVPFAIGVVLQQLIHQRPVAAIIQCFGLLLFLGLALVASATGYLGPSHQPQLYEESRNRFVVLHCYVLPGTICAALIGWFQFLGPRKVT